MKLHEVVYPIVGEIAVKLEQEDTFREDPELYTVSLLLAARKKLRPGMTIGQGLETAAFESNMNEAKRLLKRKKVTTK